MSWVMVRERTFARDGFGNRNAVLRCKCAENVFGAGVAYASA